MSVDSPSSERRIEQEVVVTGEAVALDVLPATVGSRVISGVIDYGIYFCGLILSSITFSALNLDSLLITNHKALGIALLSLIFFFWLVALPLSVELFSRGRSAGRLVTGTRVVRDDGGPVHLRHCLVRTLLAVVEVWLTCGSLAFGASAVNKRGKRLGDWLAGTYIIHDRNDVKDAAPLIMPPELSQWAHEADLRELPSNLALVTRTFLQRASSTDPAARYRIGNQLAAQVEPFVSPPPPAHTNAERFLAAVLVERRNREYFLSQHSTAAERSALKRTHQLPYGL